MTTKFLEAKLQELQCILDEALLHGPETHSHNSISSNIKKKLSFIRNFVSAEVSSHPSLPHNLHHISEWLYKLERDFDSDGGKALDETGLVVSEEPEKVCLDSNCEEGVVEYSGAVAAATGCVEEDKETGNGFDNLASSDYEDAEDVFEDFTGDKEVVGFVGDLLTKSEGEGNDLEGEGRREITFGERFRAMAGGVVIGMILMAFIIMLNTSDCFHYVEELSFAVPT
ncbi:unnamed protein product [Sphenostylis stenocarpa]|uniref:DUF7610 domain-containing protein n=1 Tax=Sphenostylis stenocarpa TaxID=92480 RepID=A0AA86RY78_9FABA|nr:unnamed protein product [Sphenostylis stenocarpa]